MFIAAPSTRGSVRGARRIATPDTAERRSAFAERVLRQASRRRFGEAQRMVVVADGAPWVRNIAQELLPGAIRIVDPFHVKQTPHRTAGAIFGSPGERAKQWATARCAELDDGKFSAIVRALRPRSRMQNCPRNPSYARWHAADAGQRQQRRRAGLLPSQRAV
jgi:transposase